MNSSAASLACPTPCFAQHTAGVLATDAQEEAPGTPRPSAPVMEVSFSGILDCQPVASAIGNRDPGLPLYTQQHQRPLA